MGTWKRIIIILLFLFMSLFFTLQSNVYAFNPFGELSTQCQPSSSTSPAQPNQNTTQPNQNTSTSKSPSSQTICKSALSPSLTNPVTGVNGVLNKVSNFIAILAGIASVIIIFLAGFMFVTSGGNPEKIKKAKSTIIYTVIGIVIIVFAKIIIRYVIVNA